MTSYRLDMTPIFYSNTPLSMPQPFYHFMPIAPIYRRARQYRFTLCATLRLRQASPSSYKYVLISRALPFLRFHVFIAITILLISEALI